MDPKELINYLANQDPITNLPMDPAMATGQMPGVPALPGFEDNSIVKSPYPSIPQARHETDEIKRGDIDENEDEEFFSDGGIVNSVKDHLSKIYDKAQKGPLIEDSTLQGLQNMVNGSSDTAKGYADGGRVEPDPAEPGSPDATVMDFLLPYLGGKAVLGGPSMPAEGDVYGSELREAMKRSMSEPAKGYADGGIVDSTPIPPVFNPQSGLPPVPPPVTAPISNVPNPYFDSQRQQVQKYGPDQQLAVAQDILNKRNSVAGKAPQALGGLADALMQGVARAGNPGFQDKIQNQQNINDQIQLDSLKNAQEGNLKQVAAIKSIDEEDPNSTYSKITAEGYAPIAAMLGLKSFEGMPASKIESMANLLAQYGGKQMEVAVARLKAQIEARRDAEAARHNTVDEKNTQAKTAVDQARLAQEIANQKQQRDVENARLKESAVEKAASEPLTSRIAGALGFNPAQEKLNELGEINQPGSGVNLIGQAQAYATAHKIPLAQAQAILDMRRGKK